MREFPVMRVIGLVHGTEAFPAGIKRTASQMEQLNQASMAAKNLGQTPTGSQNALTVAMNMLSAYNSPSSSQF
jgi:hypothetical protein